MKKLLLAMMAVMVLAGFGSCNDSETYADQRNRELDSINAFLSNEHVTVISESEFKTRFEARKTDQSVVLTDTTAGKNEYVLFESNGIYMQVINDGCGDYIKQGSSKNVYCRFREYCISARAAITGVGYTLSNISTDNAYFLDEINVYNNSGTFTGSFVDTSRSLMALTYNTSTYGSVSATVPSGWLVPFTWIKLGRLINEDDELAHVRLLIPHSYGTTAASSNVYAYLYDITFQQAR